MSNNNNTHDNTISDNLPVKMTPEGNLASKVKNGSKMESEVFANTLKWFCQALQLEHCLILTGAGQHNDDTTCTYLHALRPMVDAEESPALRMLACWSC